MLWGWCDGKGVAACLHVGLMCASIIPFTDLVKVLLPSLKICILHVIVLWTPLRSDYKKNKICLPNILSWLSLSCHRNGQ